MLTVFQKNYYDVPYASPPTQNAVLKVTQIAIESCSTRDRNAWVSQPASANCMANYDNAAWYIIK